MIYSQTACGVRIEYRKIMFRKHYEVIGIIGNQYNVQITDLVRLAPLELPFGLRHENKAECSLRM